LQERRHRRLVIHGVSSAGRRHQLPAFPSRRPYFAISIMRN
jgi:hypothetical protein